MAKIRVNHYGSKTIDTGTTVDWESVLIEIFIACLLAVFAYMGYVANIALLLFPCALSSVAIFSAISYNIFLVAKEKMAKNKHKDQK